MSNLGLRENFSEVFARGRRKFSELFARPFFSESTRQHHSERFLLEGAKNSQKFLLGRAKNSQNFLLAPVFQLFQAATQYQIVLLRGVFPLNLFFFCWGSMPFPVPSQGVSLDMGLKASPALLRTTWLKQLLWWKPLPCDELCCRSFLPKGPHHNWWLYDFAN